MRVLGNLNVGAFTSRKGHLQRTDF